MKQQVELAVATVYNSLFGLSHVFRTEPEIVIKNVIKKKRKSLIISNFPYFWSGLLDSNQRPRAPQTCALPTALNPDPFKLGTDPKCRMRVQKYTDFSEYANI